MNRTKDAIRKTKNNGATGTRSSIGKQLRIVLLEDLFVFVSVMCVRLKRKKKNAEKPVNA